MNPMANLIACPACDALYTVTMPRPGERATCARCHKVLIAPKAGAMLRVVALAVAVLILLVGVVFLPFLRIEAQGRANESSIFDVALAFSGGLLAPLALAVAVLIVVLPLTRMLLILYTLWPIARGHAPYAGAGRAFRWSEMLRPWAMAEVFILGCAVALVKIAQLAEVIFGPAFWMFAALVIITAFKDTLMDRWTIWTTLEQSTSTR